MEENKNLEEKILNLRQNLGYTIPETLKELNIKRKQYDQIVDILTQQGLYDEYKVRDAINEKNLKLKRKRIYEKLKNKPKLPTLEAEYFKKCKDILSFDYFNYAVTKKYNPSITLKLNDLYRKGYSYKTIYNVLLSQQNSLQYANKKQFNSDYNKLCYIMVIISSKLPAQVNQDKNYEEASEGLKKRIDDNEISSELNKKRISKPSHKLDMSEFLD